MSSQDEFEAQYRHEGAGVVEERPGLLESSNIAPLDHMKGSGYPVDSQSASRAPKQGMGQQNVEEALGGGEMNRGRHQGHKERQMKQKPFSQTDTRNFYK